MNPTEIIRNYRGSDAEMTETARVIHGLMVSDLAKFTAFDSTITPPSLKCSSKKQSVL